MTGIGSLSEWLAWTPATDKDRKTDKLSKVADLTATSVGLVGNRLAAGRRIEH